MDLQFKSVQHKELCLLNYVELNLHGSRERAGDKIELNVKIITLWCRKTWQSCLALEPSCVCTIFLIHCLNILADQMERFPGCWTYGRYLIQSRTKVNVSQEKRKLVYWFIVTTSVSSTDLAFFAFCIISFVFFSTFDSQEDFGMVCYIRLLHPLLVPKLHVLPQSCKITGERKTPVR